jgi:anti-repressor protein
MKAEIKLFDFNSNQIRVFVNENNEPEFCASDVTKILGYTNGSKAISDHCKSGGITKRYTPSKSGNQEYTFISEANLYRLIAKSNLPEAEKFEACVFEEILPSIRKHGAYMTAEVIEKVLTDPDTIIQLATNLKIERAEKERLQVQTELQQKELKQAAPKVEYFDTVMQSESTYTTTQIAKELGMSAISLNQILHEKGIQFKQSGQWLLYSKYHDFGYVKTKTYAFTKNDGTTGTSSETVWTEKGRKFIHDLMKQEKKVA